MPLKPVPNLLPAPDPRLGEIVFYVRLNGRSPAEAFFNNCEKRFQKKFVGSFGTIIRCGKSYCQPQRFIGLQGEGAPMWEFKEHDHRIYCAREVISGEYVRIVLLSGWIKDKTRGRQQKNEIETALRLLGEYKSEGGSK